MRIDQSGDGLFLVILLGDWKSASQLPSANEAIAGIEKRGPVRSIAFDAQELLIWGSGLLTFLVSLINCAEEKNISVNHEGLPDGVQRLLRLAFAVPEHKVQAAPRETLFSKIGEAALNYQKAVSETVGFIGEITLGMLKIFTGSARFRWADLLLAIQECGVKALPIVSLISILVGLILAFVGSIQLKMFGAQIYIADLVGIAMVRAMGAIMAGIIMAGRTGASYAAHIGTMEVNEEIDALRTAGIAPVEFLVLPRVIALALMMPLLTLYADVMGIIGGMFVGIAGFDISLLEYLHETKKAITLTNVWIGVISGFVYGIIIAVAGCLRGMQCGRSASAVGDATTSAVVTSIVSIIVATAIITILCNVLGI